MTTTTPAERTDPAAALEQIRRPGLAAVPNAAEFQINEYVKVRVPNLADEPEYRRTQINGYVVRRSGLVYYFCNGFEAAVPGDRIVKLPVCESCGAAQGTLRGLAAGRSGHGRPGPDV